jgi:beta-N-acetylhexosaminidase
MAYFKSSLILRAILFCMFGLFPNYVLANSVQNPVQNPVDKALSRMSLDQKVGQLFMIGFPQTQIDPQLQRFIAKTKPGAFLMFKRNIKSLQQIQALNSQLSAVTLKSAGIRPFIAVDQEGGIVSRIPVQPPMPNALALGMTDSAELAQSYGEVVGNLLFRLGFNMNLAPVLDLSDPDEPSFIGVRSLGGNPERVGDLGQSLSVGLHESKVIPTAKHFPGLGSSTQDPHAEVITRITSLDDFYATDLKPFEKFAKIGNETAIMLSHLSYPVLDSSNVPAVFSEKIVKGLLRGKLGFKGLVITDDLMMKGASKFARPEDAAVLALKAGADIIMVTWSFKSQEQAFLRVKKAVLDKEISTEDLDEKVRRILQAKLLSYPTKENKLLARSVASTNPRKLHEIEENILETNLKTQSQKLSNINGPLCVIATRQSFLLSYKKGATQAASYYFLSDTSTGSQLEAVLKRKNCTQVVFPIYGKKSAALIDGVAAELKEKVTVINLSAPAALSDADSFKSVVNLYFAHLNAGQKLAQHIAKNKTD